MTLNELTVDGIFCDGDWIEKKDQDPNGTVRLIQLADIGEGEFKDKSERFITEKKALKLHCTFLEKGDILIARLPEPLGRACIFPLSGKYITAVDIAIVRIKNSQISVPYVMHMINSSMFRKQIKKFESGTTRKRISRKNLEKITFNLPTFAEQQRVVTRIEELFSNLDKAVEMLQTTKTQLSVYRQAVLKEAFEGKWHYLNRHTPDTDLKFNSIKPLELDKLEVLPHEWKYVYLSDLGELSRGKSKHRPRNDERLFKNGKYPFFQTGDVKAAKENLVTCSKMYGEYGLKQSKLWPSGTLCITIAANIAETCFLGVDGCFPDSIVGFTANDSIVNKEYIRFFIEASKKRLWAFAPATAQKNINLTTLENLIVPYCTLDEQEYIIGEIKARLSVCDSIEQTVDTALQQAEALRQSILKQAFEGRLV